MARNGAIATEPQGTIDGQGWTIPVLQDWLDQMPRGGRLSIGSPDMARLFGINDVAVARAARFATGHGCRVLYGSGEATFEKMT